MSRQNMTRCHQFLRGVCPALCCINSFYGHASATALIYFSCAAKGFDAAKLRAEIFRKPFSDLGTPASAYCRSRMFRPIDQYRQGAPVDGNRGAPPGRCGRSPLDFPEEGSMARQ
jgi:hypothetical protein